MKPHPLAEQSLDFAVEIVRLCDCIERHAVLKNQLLRSATSIGANIHEANYASSKADFINKFHIALKECAETEFWIEMMVGSHCIDNETAEQLLQEYGIVRRMLSKSIITAKNSNP